MYVNTSIYIYIYIYNKLLQADYLYRLSLHNDTFEENTNHPLKQDARVHELYKKCWEALHKRERRATGVRSMSVDDFDGDFNLRSAGTKGHFTQSRKT